jgi:hypothetical protein
MTSRYEICKQTLLHNTLYAKNKNINIVIILFDTSARIYTNTEISELTKGKLITNTFFSFELHEKLTYEQIIDHIEKSNPMGGTDFLIPFTLFDNIKEFEKGDIFFLSDGYNSNPLENKDIEFLNNFKHRITTLGIGNKNNFDYDTLSDMSKNNLVVEGNTAEIIQQELLAQMSDSTTNDIDEWTDVKIVLYSQEDILKCGSMMEVERITEDEYNSINYISNTNNSNLILEKYESNNFIIKKKYIEIDTNININRNTLYFIVDQSGSMDDDINNDYNNDNNSQLLLSDDNLLNDQDNDNISNYIKYTYKLSNMKYYHRIIFHCMDISKFKGYISWTDKTGNKIMSLTESSKYINKDDLQLDNILTITNELGHLINISNVCDNSEKIGNFRKINKICKDNEELFEMFNNNIINDSSLTELLFFNKKYGMKLYNNTLSYSEHNMNELLAGICSGGGARALSAAVTMSSINGQTPSQQPYSDKRHDKYDMTLCTICFLENRQYIFSCGHCYSCYDCAQKLLISEPKNKCSYCKKDVKWIRKITMTDEQKDNKHYFKCISDNCYNIATIVAECKPINSEDNGYHLTYCKRCYKNILSNYKKTKKTRVCFCGQDILKIKENIYFN